MSGSGKHIIIGGMLINYMSLFSVSDFANGQVPYSMKVLIRSDFSHDSLNMDNTKIIEDTVQDIVQDCGPSFYYEF